MVSPSPDELFIDGEPYELLEIAPGRHKWDVIQVVTQPGDGGKPAAYPLEFHAGFGASRRFYDAAGKVNDPGHHAYSQNWMAHVKGVGAAAPRITYLDVSTLSGRSKGFIFGGYKRSRLGGTFPNGLGGGDNAGIVACAQEFGSDYLYFAGGSRTFVIDADQATPTHVETKQHPVGSTAFSSEVFDNSLAVALGGHVDMAVATSPRSGSNDTVWTSASNVKRSVVRKGAGGRFFSAKDNLVFNVLPSQDITSSASYLPTSGEEITDETDPVRGLAEWARGLVASTARTVRTFDPDAGFQSRALLGNVRVSVSDYDGRALITVGEIMFDASPRAVWMFVPGKAPQKVGPELMSSNETPYVGGQPGVPDFDGEVLHWPYYFPTTGDSVIFRVEPREDGDPGTGPLAWNEELWLDDRECRVVKYWGGNATYKPRLFFGAGTPANPEQVGWVQLGRGGTPDIFDSGSVPALSAVLYGAIDDFGRPGVMREVERVEFPDILNADANNHLAVAISDDRGSTFKNLVVLNTGVANDERITGTGFQQVFSDIATPSIPAGRWLGVRFTITQASGATTHLQYRGTPQLYVIERPAETSQVTTLLRLNSLTHEDSEVRLARLRAHKDGAKVPIAHGPGDVTAYGKVLSVDEVEIDITDGAGNKTGRTVATQISWRVVPTS